MPEFLERVHNLEDKVRLFIDVPATTVQESTSFTKVVTFPYKTLTIKGFTVNCSDVTTGSAKLTIDTTDAYDFTLSEKVHCSADLDFGITDTDVVYHNPAGATSNTLTTDAFQTVTLTITNAHVSADLTFTANIVIEVE